MFRKEVAVPTGARCIGTGSVAVAALAFVLMASTASATTPGFGRCVKQTGGKYANAGCTKVEAGKNKFEWYPGLGGNGINRTGVRYHYKTGVTGKFVWQAATFFGYAIECNGEMESHGATLTGPDSIQNIVLDFSGCASSFDQGACTTAGHSAGVIETEVLTGLVVTLKVGTTPLTDKMGLLLRPEGSTPFAVANCNGDSVVIRGGMLHPVVSNKMSSTFAENYVGKAGEQTPSYIAGGSDGEFTLELSNPGLGAGFFESDISGNLLAEYEESIELNTVA